MLSTCCWALPLGGHPVPAPRRGPSPSLGLHPSPLAPSLLPPAAPLPLPKHPCCALTSRGPPGSAVPQALGSEHMHRPVGCCHCRQELTRACLFICLLTSLGRQNGSGGFTARPSCRWNREDRCSVPPPQTEQSPALPPACRGPRQAPRPLCPVSPDVSGGAGAP